MNHIGPTIRRLRIARNLTQEYMAMRLKVGVTAYGNIERNDVKRLTLERVMEIARVLNVHYSELLGCQEPRQEADSGVMAVVEYLRRDKLLMQELLKAYKEMYAQLERMTLENGRQLHHVLTVQQEIVSALLECKR